MSITVAAITFGIIFLAELPDKTALASLVLGTRYRAGYVFAGIAAAFAVHVALAIAAGSLLSLLPHRWVEAVVGLLFLGGALMLLLQKDEDEDGEKVREPASTGFWRVAATGFVTVLIAEFGDLTQITTANLAAKYTDPLAVGLGSWLALCAVAGVAIVGGKKLMKHVPLRLITRIAAVVMLVMAGVSIVGAITG
ncbi:TMEM165/GDT1 family protein [Streptacidiphilus sp. PB12-B1b]|uniref:TMEM165/GDT1 family protein n=1 Tax=Streptacidiphilus sp. PB12-B1b TaxID=2705012 RepID=UPI0015FD9167|nr:TMEM165/GDT1 family protein [Streptacidiphilus sp. PB12-B1b]QMU75665.1 TMEM165/GDT1 family protein [Streptacidiphilus sp. PB12-B1b]